MFDGFARIIHGFTDKQLRGWSRGFSIGVGILAVVISVMILVSPFFGLVLAGFFIGIALIIIGIQMIVAGFVWQGNKSRSHHWVQEMNMGTKSPQWNQLVDCWRDEGEIQSG